MVQRLFADVIHDAIWFMNIHEQNHPWFLAMLYIWLCCSNRWAYFLLVSYYRLEMGFVDDLSMFSVRHCLVTFACWASSLLFLRKTDIERWIFLHMFFRSVLLFLVSTELKTFVILQWHFFSASFKITILVPKYDSPVRIIFNIKKRNWSLSFIFIKGKYRKIAYHMRKWQILIVLIW
jgi:hypothetical protein